MSGPKPALGYPSRTAAVLALRADDVPTGEIARRLGIEPKTVAALEVSAARKHKRQDAGEGRAILIPDSALRGLRRAASRRGMTPHKLARVIVVTVADNDLIDAVLDDDAPSESRAPSRDDRDHEDKPVNLLAEMQQRGLR